GPQTASGDQEGLRERSPGRNIGEAVCGAPKNHSAACGAGQWSKLEINVNSKMRARALGWRAGPKFELQFSDDTRHVGVATRARWASTCHPSNVGSMAAIVKRWPTQDHSTLLNQILSQLARRYRLPIRREDALDREHYGVAPQLALIIERVRETVVSGRQPDEAQKKQFLDTLARLIHDAMLDDEGDSAFQAMTLRHGAPRVREYASLAARSDPDRRAVLALVNTMAHPARQERTGDASLRAALAAVHDAASEQAWTRLHTLLRELARIGATSTDTDVSRPAAALLEHPALARLQRLEALRADEQVGRYLKLWEKNGPRTGSDEALREGARSRRRGAAVEALAAKALTVLAEGLNEVETTGAIYRVVTSLRVPAAILNGRERAKSEWDAVLLGRSAGVSDDQGWDVCLLLEAKASA